MKTKTKALFFTTPDAFRAWFEQHHAVEKELLVGFHKRDSGRPSITWPESVDCALSYGWIDGVRNSIDGISYQIRFTPRKPTSIWSAINVKRVAELTRLDLMRPSGVKAFEARKGDKTGIYAYEQRKNAKQFRLTSIEDRNHNRIELSYDGERLAQIVDSAGRAYDVESTPEGRIAAILLRLPEGRVLRLAKYEYDDRGDLIAVTDADGYSWRYTYHDDHLMASSSRSWITSTSARWSSPPPWCPSSSNRYCSRPAADPSTSHRFKCHEA